MTPGLKEPGMDLQSTGLVFVLMIKKEHLKSHHLCKVPSNPVQPPSGPWIAVATPLITGGRGGGLIVELSFQGTPGPSTIGDAEIVILKMRSWHMVMVYILFLGALHLAFPHIPLSLKRVELGLI